MKIELWSIGKPHEKELKAAIDHFTKRSGNYFPVEWNIIPLPKNAGLMSESDMKKKEAELILEAIADRDYLIALDERGKSFTSAGLAAFIQAKANSSTKRVIFLIGGAYGLDDQVLKRANTTWSLSSLTFPHQLVRLILVEQLYRAFTIIRNEKYHHG